MATSEILTQSERGALDNVLRPHLRLEPLLQAAGKENHEEDAVSSGGVQLARSLGTSADKGRARRISDGRSRSKSETDRPFSRPTVHQSTAEADNKRRPGVIRRISTRYRSPSPEPPDPNSEAKSQTIRRMQSNLETWDKQLKEIVHKKQHNDSVTRSEIKKKDNQLQEMTERYDAECERRRATEQERDSLNEELRDTTEELDDNKCQVKQLQGSLEQYQLAYRELDESKTELEGELEAVKEQLQKSEGMRHRMNDEVTELQGRLAIEEQRSRFCTVL